MKKSLLIGGMLSLMAMTGNAAVAPYDAAAAKENAKADFANWMKYLPDDVFVAHVSIPGTHDTATAEGWVSSTGSSYSTTQEKTIDEQLAGGIRAFDFRPGMVSGELWCNHGTDQTKLKLADAFKKLTNYLDAHPSEFFVIHIFRGNIFRSGEGGSSVTFLGGKNDEASQKQYNELFNQFFNQGSLADYIVEYSPTLKVKDMRGKMVIFRRDRIDFAHIFKAGNLSNWPGDKDMWTANQMTTVTRDSDPTVRGIMRATDVSSPGTAAELETELNSIKGLFDWQCNQTLPNDAKRNGSYKPDWSMIFTSGAYGGENTDGYKKNAAQTNPYFTNLINTATKKGPTGVVLSDWVLTDNYNSQGIALVPAIIYNNFDYISDYILDDELFGANDVEYENIWDDSKEYFMRNVGTGDFLTAGEWWGTHAATGAHGIKVKLSIDKSTGKYTINTTLNAGGGFGSNCYVDNTNPMEFDVEYVGDGKYVFSGELEGNGYKAIAAFGDMWGEFAYDGTTHNVDGADKNITDPMQQWEIISVEDYLAQQLKSARRDKGADVSFLIPGGRFFGNDTEINSWSFSSTSAKRENPGVGENDSRRVLNLCNGSKPGGLAGLSWNAKWTLKKEVTNLPKGIYTLRWKAYNSNITDHSMSVTMGGVKHDVKSQLQSGSISNYTAKDAMKTIGAEMKDDKYTCKLENIKITDGKITIDASAPSHSSITAFILDDFELIYFGPIYPVLERAIEDAKRRLGSTPDWLATYENNMNNLTYDQEDEGAAPALEIYQKLRELTLAQTPDDTNHQDYTNALINAGFETGTMMGWETSFNGGDTGVKPNEGVYVTQGGHNTFLFNCWQDNRGVVLSQTIPGLPAGHYIVTAEAANDENGCMYIEVNGQRSDALVVEEGKGIAKLITFEFEVAENTEEVKISFFGGNADGSFDDFGGNWYKVDDVHLYRYGSADYCVFYRRLMKALERMDNMAAKTLPQYYQDKWDGDEYHISINDIIKNHLESDHSDGNLNGSNGINERNTLYDHFSAVVLSQAETNANMSGAIRNNSFELGDLSYWTTKAEPISESLVTESKEDKFNISGRDDKNIYYSNLEGKAYPIYQTISGLPAGKYRLSASVASTNGNKFYLAANDAKTLITTTNENAFQTEEVEFEIAEDNSDLLFGLYPSEDGNFTSQAEQADAIGPWYAVDNFELRLIGRQVSIDWTMETPTHGTIILPFNHDIPEGLEIYTVKQHEESIAQGATHKILVYEKQDGPIMANTPYVIIANGQNAPAETSVAKAKAADNTNAATYKFSGFTTNESMNYKNEYKDGALVGVMVETPVDAAQYHLQSYEDNIGFVLHEEGPEHTTIAPYHAYVVLPENSELTQNIHGLYFEEPVLPLNWYMEGSYYGTIILPFEADVPENMKAYKLTGLGAVTSMPETTDETYQIISTELANAFEANVPYLVMMDSASDSNEDMPEARSVAENETEETINAYRFVGKAINDKLTYTHGILTGVHTATTPETGAYVLVEDEKDAMFVPASRINSVDVEANHAYITPSSLSENPADYLLLTAPNIATSVEEILASDGNVDIYTVGGMMIRNDVAPAQALRELAPGIYILRSGDKSVKVIKK